MEGCEEFFISVGKSYIVTALMKYFGMDDVDDYPTLNAFPPNMMHAQTDVIQRYFDEKMNDFVNDYIFHRNQAPPIGDDEDYVKNYSLLMLYLTIVLLQIKDTAAEGDGERLLINQKLLLGIFKSFNNYSKYGIEMFVSIAQIECMLTERMSAECKWGFFCNWTGGVGRNIEDDLAQEKFQ